MGDEFEGAGAGYRWLTVGPKDQPEVELILTDPRMGNSPGTAEQVRSLVAAGAFGAGSFKTDDCRATYETLTERGVVFVQEPTDRPYGVEAVFRDDSGNWFSLTEPRG